MKMQMIKKSFVCEVCSKSFARNSTLQRHASSHGLKQFDCSYCSRSFSRKDNLIQHEKMHTGKKRFVCIMCDKSFDYKFSLDKHICHIKTHPGEKPFYYKSIIKKATLTDLPKNTRETPCGQASTTKNDLAIQNRVHSGERPHTCNVCSRTFSCRSSLTKHTVLHTGLKQFSCGLCNKRFSRKYNLTDHFRVHTGEKPFACVMCSKTFPRKQWLLTHISKCRNNKLKQKDNPIVSETNPLNKSKRRDIICSLCRKSFTETEMVIVVNKAAETLLVPYSCCKDFPEETSRFCLEDMIFSCTKCVFSGDQICMLCGKAIRLFDLRTHLGIHVGEVIQCQKCGKTFLESEVELFIQHVAFCNGLVLKHCSVCDECGESFSDDNDLRLHKRESHDEVVQFKYL